ncbi:MAG: type II toxin-antitoxin system VapC family toxin [Acidobacteria bacterium]|nr:type II toxin-antitoxin system VapC family toxin [Acidobacteriota bacterium]
MKLLLDTHVWIWAARNDGRLRTAVAGAISNPDSQLFLSPVSIWEAGLLFDRGIFETYLSRGRWLSFLSGQVDLQEAPVTFEIAREMAMLDWSHKDPADRFLVATARVLGLVLVTADERIIDSRLVPMIDAR